MGSDCNSSANQCKEDAVRISSSKVLYSSNLTEINFIVQALLSDSLLCGFLSAHAQWCNEHLEAYMCVALRF